MNKMFLVLGDWSNDGHGKYDKILLESDVDVEDIQKAYKDSCKLTGVEFNHNSDYTNRKRDWSDREKYQICVDYQCNTLRDEVFNILTVFGLTKKMLVDWDIDNMNDDTDENYVFSPDSFTKLWIWFVKLSLPKNVVLREVSEQDNIPVINGYWNKKLPEQFGYGLYVS